MPPKGERPGSAMAARVAGGAGPSITEPPLAGWGTWDISGAKGVQSCVCAADCGCGPIREDQVPEMPASPPDRPQMCPVLCRPPGERWCWCRGSRVARLRRCLAERRETDGQLFTVNRSGLNLR